MIQNIFPLGVGCQSDIQVSKGDPRHIFVNFTKWQSSSQVKSFRFALLYIKGAYQKLFTWEDVYYYVKMVYQNVNIKKLFFLAHEAYSKIITQFSHQNGFNYHPAFLIQPLILLAYSIPISTSDGGTNGSSVAFNRKMGRVI